MATAADHYARAEIAQDAAADLQAEGLTFTSTEALLDGICHALLAIARELGVPDTPPAAPLAGTGDASVSGQGITLAPGGGS